MAVELSVEEYLALERQSETRSEYREGRMIARPPSNRFHNLITGHVSEALHRQMKGRSGEVYVAAMRVRLPVDEVYVYPDVVAVCRSPEFEDAEEDTLLNPTLIVEVLSPSTESYDRGSKFAYYRTLPSFAEYLLLTQDRVHAEHHVRQGDDGWLLTETDRREDVLELPSIGCTLALANVYDRVA